MLNKQTIKFLILILAGLWLLAFAQKGRLPSQDNIDRSTLKDPRQTETSKEPFIVSLKGETYTITPVADYELNGMVVALHHSSSWLDISHEKWHDYLNIVDLCVMYDQNISTGVYQHLKYSHGDWTCYVSWSGSDDEKYQASQKYKNEDLSNNHLLTKDPEIARKILSVGQGDQIYLKGYLAEYANHRWKEYPRKTSITREDQGGTACEVIYVEKFEILNQANGIWRFLYFICPWLIMVLIIWRIVISFLDARSLLNKSS